MKKLLITGAILLCLGILLYDDTGNTQNIGAWDTISRLLDNTTLTGTTTIETATITTLNADSLTTISHGTPWDLTDGQYTGTTVVGLADENLSFGQVCYLDGDQEYALVDADVLTTMPGLVMALGTISADAYGLFLQRGYVCETSWTTVSPTNDSVWVYAGVTAGRPEIIRPTGSGDQVQKIGYVIAEDIMFFNPSYTITGIQ